MTAQEALEKIDEKLYILMEGDKRTMKNPITEDGLYYEGLYTALKVVDEYAKQVTQ